MLVDIPTKATIEMLVARGTEKSFAKLSIKLMEMEMEKDLARLQEEIKVITLMYEKVARGKDV